MKILTFLSLVTWMINCGYSQEIKIGFQSGYGKYSMTGLDDYCKRSFNYDLPTKIVSDFPGYLYYRPSIVVKFEDINIGLIYTFQSTGARKSYKDYSGEYLLDMLVKSNCPGIYMDLSIKTIKKTQLSIYSILGATFSHLNINNFLELSDSVLQKFNRNYKAYNWFVEPGISINYPFEQFEIGANFGYNIRFNLHEYYYVNDDEVKLINTKDNDPINPDWNGIRLGFSIQYRFIIKNNFNSKN